MNRIVYRIVYFTYIYIYINTYIKDIFIRNFEYIQLMTNLFITCVVTFNKVTK